MKRKVMSLFALLAIAAGQSAIAQSSNCVSTSTDHVRQVYDKHIQCAVDISIARMFVKQAQPDTLPKFEEALGSYLNRLLGVGEAVDLTRQQVTTTMLEQVRLQTAKIKESGSDVSGGAAKLKVHMDRAKECLNSIGYSVS